MVQKIEIHNFGPIGDAAIEVRPLLVLIGQQASGKSTVAKLIYFFQSLAEEFFSRYYQSETEMVDISRDLQSPIREKFYDFFGSTFHLPHFEITYHYGEQRSLTLSLTDDKRISAHFSEGFFSRDDFRQLRTYKKALMQLKDEMAKNDNMAQRVALNEQHLNYLHLLADKINDLFRNRHNDSLFILAGRNATIGYSETFENMLQQSIQRNIDEQGSRAFEAKEQTIDETLMLSFMRRTVKMRQQFVKLGNFEGMIANADEPLKGRLKLANKLIRRVLKGQYSNSEYGERITHRGGYVFLKNASSGQQESIRILQDAFLSIYQGNRLLRIVEEPEAHVFPEAQMATIQLLALMLNASPDNNLIITTHSPYTLTVINNLLYAGKVGARHHDEVSKVVDCRLWLTSGNVSAYLLDKGNAEDIMDPEIGEIKAELIDGISGVINSQYETILQYDDGNGAED